MQDKKTVVHLSNDLMMSSAVRAQATAVGLAVDFVNSMQSLDTLLSTNEPDLILVDLQLPNMDLNQLREALSRCPSATNVILYAQHVNKELLDAAESIGRGQVLTRGQFAKSLTQLLSTPAPRIQ